MGIEFTDKSNIKSTLNLPDPIISNGSLICLLSAVWCLTLNLATYSFISFNYLVIIFSSTIFAMLYHFTYIRSKKTSYIICGVVVIISVLMLCLTLDQIFMIASLFTSAIYTGVLVGVPTTTSTVLAISLILTTYIFLFAYAFDIQAGNYLLLYLSTIISTIVGSGPSFLSLFFLLIYHFGFLILKSPYPINKNTFHINPKKVGLDGSIFGGLSDGY